MEKIIIKFVVLVPENAFWIEQQAIKMYTGLLPNVKEEVESYLDNNLSFEKLMGQNDFSVEKLMAYEGEKPLAFLQFDSSYHVNQHIQSQSPKPVFIQHTVHEGEAGLRELFERVMQIAIQRKYTLIWVKALRKDRILIELLLSSGYDEFELTGQEEGISLIEYIYLRKALI